MKATTWEFENRAFIFGMIFAVSFPLYYFDPQNSAAALAEWVAARLQMNGDLVARLLFAAAAVLLIVAAFVRTWASSHLHAEVVYASQVKTASLVADGPYNQSGHAVKTDAEADMVLTRIWVLKGPFLINEATWLYKRQYGKHPPGRDSVIYKFRRISPE